MVNSDDVELAMSRIRSVDPSYFLVYPGGDNQFSADCRTLAMAYVNAAPLIAEGNDLMESMQAEIDELRAVLMPFASIAKKFGTVSQTVLSPIFLNDCESAKSALDRANQRNGQSPSETSSK